MSVPADRPSGDEKQNYAVRRELKIAAVLTPMRSFCYRVPRYLVDLPVQLTWEEAIHFVRCIEISSEGMRIELYGECPRKEARGSIQLSHDDQNLKLPFKVLYSGPGACGIAFMFESIEQKKAVCRLVAALSAPRACTSLALRN